MRAQPAATPSVMAWTSSMSLVVCGLYVAVATSLRSGPGHGAAPFGVALAAVVAGGLVILGHRRFRTWHYHLLQPGTGAAVAPVVDDLADAVGPTLQRYLTGPL